MKKRGPQILVVVADNQNWEYLRSKLIMNGYHVDQLRRVAIPTELQDVLAMSGTSHTHIVMDLEYAATARIEFIDAVLAYREKISLERRPWVIVACNLITDLGDLIFQEKFRQLSWKPARTLLDRILDEIK